MRGLCAGVCLGLCPPTYLLFYDGQLAVPESLRARGPVATRSFTAEPPLDAVVKAWQARATDLTGRVQYGGVVSAFTALALEQGLIGGEAMLTQGGHDQGADRGPTRTGGVLGASETTAAANKRGRAQTAREARHHG